MNEKESQRKSKDLMKHTSAIHCSNSLSLLQRKISNVLLYHAYQYLLETEEHKISIKELCRYLGYKGNNYKVIKESLVKLISTVIEWNLTDDNNEENWTASSILASVNIYKSICTYAYSPRMKSLLFSPSMYGKINLLIQSQFTSSYGLALYENCARYKDLGYTKNFPIDVFRKIMGVPDSTYQIFRDFKKRVLNKAVDEVNALTGFLVEPEIKRVGQKVISIRFKIKPRDKKKRFAHECVSKEKDINDATNQSILLKLKAIYGVKEPAGEKLIHQYGIHKIEEEMIKIESSTSYLGGKIKNMGGYLVSFLSNEFSQLSSNKVQLVSRRDAENAKELAFKKEQHQLNKDRKYSAYIHKVVCESYQLLDPQEKKTIEDEFLTALTKDKNHIILIKAKKQGVTEGISKLFFCQFIMSSYPALVADLPSKEEYLVEKI